MLSQDTAEKLDAKKAEIENPQLKIPDLPTLAKRFAVLVGEWEARKREISKIKKDNFFLRDKISRLLSAKRHYLHKRLKERGGWKDYQAKLKTLSVLQEDYERILKRFNIFDTHDLRTQGSANNVQQKKYFVKMSLNDISRLQNFIVKDHSCCPKHRKVVLPEVSK